MTGNRLTGPQAVSYTHLDVYKRQAYSLLYQRTHAKTPLIAPHVRPLQIV